MCVLPAVSPGQSLAVDGKPPVVGLFGLAPIAGVATTAYRAAVPQHLRQYTRYYARVCGSRGGFQRSFVQTIYTEDVPVCGDAFIQ